MNSLIFKLGSQLYWYDDVAASLNLQGWKLEFVVWLLSPLHFAASVFPAHSEGVEFSFMNR
jgi:hypothetical protein